MHQHTFSTCKITFCNQNNAWIARKESYVNKWKILFLPFQKTV